MKRVQVAKHESVGRVIPYDRIDRRPMRVDSFEGYNPRFVWLHHFRYVAGWMLGGPVRDEINGITWHKCAIRDCCVDHLVNTEALDLIIC